MEFPSTAKPFRDGDWKRYLSEVKDLPESDEDAVLIHLKEDPEEQTNLAQDHPEKVSAMRALAAKMVAEIKANAIPLGGP